MSTPLQTIVFCHLQFWRMQLSSTALAEKKKTCFSLALETETTETTWFPDITANFYNEHLDKKIQTFQHFQYIIEFANLFYFTLCILTSQTSWIQRAEQLGKGKNKEMKEKRNHGKQMWRNVQLRKNLEKSGNNLFSIPNGWFLADLSSFATDANAASPCLLLHSTAGVTVMGGDNNKVRRQWGCLSMGNPSSLPQECFSQLAALWRVSLCLLFSSRCCWKTQMLCWGQLDWYHLQEVSKKQKLFHMNKI